MPDIDQLLRRHEADEAIRRRQQGRGRPIVSFEFAGRKVVAVKNRVMWANNWKTFPDFLFHYIHVTLGENWLKTEETRGEKKHLLLIWLGLIAEYQRQGVRDDDGVIKSSVNGLVLCTLGLAYNLYLIAHNAELQARLIDRLKLMDSFQGAFYELVIAGVLIRAGYVLQLEDETGRGPKHCEFSATAPSGKKFWIEAKCRAVAGIMGKTNLNGCSDAEPPTSKLVKHLSAALAKPADDDRLIFIELNSMLEPDTPDEVIRALNEEVVTKIKRQEYLGANDKSAYIFVTNLPFHRYLYDLPKMLIMPIGYNKPDFNQTGAYTLRDRYRAEIKHFEAYEIAQSFMDVGRFPSTFDGTLPSQQFRSDERIVIGETYDFGDAVPGGVGTVTAACVVETEQCAYLGVSATSGQSFILRQEMSQQALREYAEYGSAYFGDDRNVGAKNAKNTYELFKWLLSCYRECSREKIIELIGLRQIDNQNVSDFETSDLIEIYCERLAINIEIKGDAAK